MNTNMEAASSIARTFAAVAMFTANPPHESLLSRRYLCFLERGPAEDAFSLRVKSTTTDQEVLLKRFHGVPHEMHALVKEQLQTLHPERVVALGHFQPHDDWMRLVTAK